MNPIKRFNYYRKKITEIPDNAEPLTHLMIRITGECVYYSSHHKTIKTKIINSKDINILHSIDREPALKKFLRRTKFLKKNKKNIEKLVKKEGFLDLSVDWIRKDSPFSSINKEIVLEINPKGKTKKYITASGVGRVAAIQSAFPNGIKIKVDSGTIPFGLQKRLVAINSLYLHGDRFKNLKQYNIDVKEIIFTKKKSKTQKRYNRKSFLKTRKKIFRLIPWKGGFNEKLSDEHF